MYGRTPPGANLTSEFGELGIGATGSSRDLGGQDRTIIGYPREREPEAGYESFLDVGVERNKGRSRKETLKAKPAKTGSKKSRGEKEVLAGLPGSETPPRGPGGRLRKKASKIFRIDKPKANIGEPERPDAVERESTTSVPRQYDVSRSQSRSTSASLDERASLTTTSSELSLPSDSRRPSGPSSQTSQLSVSPPSRRSSRSSARSLFGKGRRRSSSKVEGVPLPGPTSYKRRGSSNSALGQSLPSSSTVPLNAAVRQWDAEDQSSLSQFTEIPEVITTSATPGPSSQKRTELYGLPSADMQQPGIGGRMSNWFANIIPTTATGTSTSPTPASGPRGGLSGNNVEGRASTRPDSIMTTRSGSIPSSTSAPARASFSSMPGDTTFSSGAPLTASPGRKMTSTTSFLQAARQKAAGMGRWVLDSEAIPEGSESIWILGVEHRFDDEAEEPSLEADVSNSEEGSWGRQYSSTRATGSPKSKRMGIKRSGSPSPSSLSTASSNYFSNKVGSLNISGSPSKKGRSPGTAETEGPSASPGRGIRSLFPLNKDKEKSISTNQVWPDSFLQDFRSIIWCTYRSQYAPILSLPPHLFLPNVAAYLEDQVPSLPNETQEVLMPSSQTGVNNGKSSWSWVSSVGAGMGLAGASNAERGLTSDAGWGCMLRTGQCLLANSLIRRHLGRDWRPPIDTTSLSTGTEEESRNLAAYVQILNWFMDDPAAICPFSVHRMALIGKQLGKEVGEWFGPSTAAGAIKTLANAFPPCGLAVSVASDGMIFRSDVYSASNAKDDGWAPVVRTLPWDPSVHASRAGFGNKAVLVLVNVRLGTNTVNPIYYDSLKSLFTAPQTVGIAGGRPSSSYYFIGYQGDSLFYLDPHFTRPAVPLQTSTSERVVETHGVSGAIPIANASTRRRQADMPVQARTREDNITWLNTAYTSEQLQTFHCDRVRKMPMSSLDPSMLLGFLIQDDDDWQDFCARMHNVRHKIFSIQDQPPTWSDDEADPGMESLSETDDGFSVPSNNEDSGSALPAGRLRSSSAGSSLLATDDEADLIISVPPTPTRRRLRPSATETTLNARAMMDDPFIHRDLAGKAVSGTDGDLAEASTIILDKRNADDDVMSDDDEPGVLVRPPSPFDSATMQLETSHETVRRG